jgi:hypothetical protein
MAKYLDWYLVELEKSIDQRLAPEALFELLNQTEDHINMIKEELMVAGLDEVSAEQAAIRRFGQLETLSGQPKAKPVLRANWAAPVLLLIGGTAVFGAAMVLGSKDSMIIASGLGAASLVVSAVLCCRRGAFPGLAFGILFAICFAVLSGIAGYEFYGPRLHFVRHSQRQLLVAALETAKTSAEHESHLLRLGEAWASGKLGRHVPLELKSPEGILCPKKSRWGAFYSTYLPLPSASWESLDGLYFSGATQSNELWYVVVLEPLRHLRDAGERWKQYGEQGDGSATDRQSKKCDEDLEMVAHGKPFEADNMFLGILAGSLIGSLWMFLAFVFNRIANVDWASPTKQSRTRSAPLRT